MQVPSAAILCVGDVMLDRYHYGEVERISPEAPVPVLRLRSTRTMLGGAGNVAHNIAALGGRAQLVGLIGNDETGRLFAERIAAISGIEPGLVTSRQRPTICKTRFLAAQQQVVRADEESALALQPEEEEALIAALRTAISGTAAIILSDYGKGVLSPAVIDAAMVAARDAGIPVFVDPKTEDFRRYRGATCITPNLKELAAAARLPVADEGGIIAAARAVMAHAEAKAILATRSAQGMILVEANGAVHSVPARAREVFDVSGAGDTVIATLALAHAGGLSLAQAMHIANAAAGVVVSKVGTATVEPAELARELAETDQDEPAPALRSWAETEVVVARWKRQGLSVGFTNGCFDILHAGHVALLAAARAQCDRLVVALNSDASVARLKGPARPINGLADRSAVLGAIRHVDCLVAFEEDTPLELIRRLLPDVLVKGADYRVEDVVGADVVQQAGGRVLLCELLAGRSTTHLVERLANRA